MLVDWNNKTTHIIHIKISIMKPILIYKDEQKIKEEIAILDKMAIEFQTINTAFKAINVSVEISDITRLVLSTDAGSVTNRVQTYVVNKLLDAAAPFELNGLKITREAFRNMIAVPYTGEIQTLVVAASRHLTHYVGGIREDLLSIIDGEVVKLPNANDKIATIYSYYTKTDKSAKLTESLQNICNAMNAFAKQHGNYFEKLLTDHKRIYSQNMMPGLTIDRNEIVVCHKYISDYERVGN
jgi:hypothetical protein